MSCGAGNWSGRCCSLWCLQDFNEIATQHQGRTERDGHRVPRGKNIKLEIGIPFTDDWAWLNTTLTESQCGPLLLRINRLPAVWRKRMRKVGSPVNPPIETFRIRALNFLGARSHVWYVLPERF